MGRSRRPGSGLAEQLTGSQEPTHKLAPPCEWTLGHDALAMAELVGIELDEWQVALLLDGLGTVEDRRGGKSRPRWAAYEVFLELARQNGKSVVLDILALTALYTWRLKRIVYSAHEGLTALEAYARLEELIKSTPALRSITPDRCFRQGNGKESIRLLTGERIIFRTRTQGGGRGLSGDLVIMDEIQEARDGHIAALFPTLRARPNPQIWYAGSAGGIESTVEGRLVRRSDKGDPRLCAYRWAASEDDDPADPRTWAKVTPALGSRVDVDWMANEQRTMAPDIFAQELLSIGDYPREEGADWVIPAAAVKATTDESTVLVGPAVFAVDAKYDQSTASIGIAGPGGRVTPSGRTVPGGHTHLEVIEQQRGVRWIGPRLLELLAAHPHVKGVVVDGKGPLARLVPDWEASGIQVHLVSPAEVVASCGWLYDAMVNEPRQVRHRGAPAFVTSVATAHAVQTIGGFRWRRTGRADGSPLWTLTLAGYAAATWANQPPPPPPPAPRTAAGSSPPQREAPTRRQRRRGPQPDIDLAHAGF